MVMVICAGLLFVVLGLSALNVVAETLMGSG